MVEPLVPEEGEWEKEENTRFHALCILQLILNNVGVRGASPHTVEKQLVTLTSPRTYLLRARRALEALLITQLVN